MKGFYSWLSVEEPLGIYISDYGHKHDCVIPLDDFFNGSINEFTQLQAERYAEKFEQFAKELREYAKRY